MSTSSHQERRWDARGGAQPDRPAHGPARVEDELWRRLDAAATRHTVHWHWVRGHAGHDLNERADQLVNEAIAEGWAGKR